LIAASPLWQFVMLLGLHWVADFVLQSRWMATNKSSRLDALSLHVAVYTTALGFGAIVIFGAIEAVLWFTAANGALHFVTDFFTSRITSKLWKEQRIHGFFLMVGLDQLIHQVTLAATMAWFLASV
jgi:uncharacterized protein DUF3307